MMKKSLKVLAFAIALAGLASCGQKPAEFTSVRYDNSFALEEGASDSISITMDIEYPEISGDERGKAIAAAITGTAFGNGYESLSPAEAMEAWADSLVAEYRESNLSLKEMLEKNGDKGPFMGMNWEFSNSGTATGTFKDILGYKLVTYSYTGGAHGIMNETHMNFDLRSGKLLEQEDVFAEGFEKQTSKLLMKHLNDGKSDDGKISLLTDTIEPNGNFSIGEEGITFTYNQYEIAAYVFGVIDILIPADEIKPYLKTGMNIYD